MSEHRQPISEDCKSIGKNSPVHFQMKPKASVFLRAPSLRSTNCPSNYVLSPHSNIHIFSKGSRPFQSRPLSTAVTQERSHPGDSVYKEHLYKTYQALRFVKSLPEPSEKEINEKRVRLKRRKGFENRRTVVFDLDETLVHCVEDPESADVRICINFPSGEQIYAGINIRPYVQQLPVSYTHLTLPTNREV